MQLTVWESDFGLISMNAECIKVLLYVKMAQAPVLIKYQKAPMLLSPQAYPIFKDDVAVHREFNDIVTYLRMRSYSIDYMLSSKQCSESYALANMLELCLKPVLQYVWWLDGRNYDELMGIWCMKAMTWPFNFIYPRLCRKQATKLIESMYPNEDNPEVIKTFMYSTASECFYMLAVRLGQLDYFYGNTPTSIDVVVYSYLAPLVKIPFPTNDIPKLLDTWPELVRFIKRIDEIYFSEVEYAEKYVHPKEPSAKKEDELSASKGTLLFALICVTFTMTSYAIAKGIITFNGLQRYLY